MTKTITYNPETHKLVPIIPTDEMEETAHEGFMPFGDMKLAIQLAINAAPAAEEAPGQEPNWKHPKIQSLIGADARNRIVIDLIWQILEQPEREDFTAADMEYWDSIHDAVKAAITKQQPAKDSSATCGSLATHGEPVASEKLLANLRALADVLYRGGNTRISDGELVLEAVGVLSALYTQPTPEHIKAMQQALEAVENVLSAAYHRRFPECCSRPGAECCGNPNEAWTREDSYIMDVLSPVQRNLSTALQNALKGTT